MIKTSQKHTFSYKIHHTAIKLIYLRITLQQKTLVKQPN